MTVHRTPVQLSGPQKVCVLVHHETKRILCFCFDDPFTKTFTDKGYQKISIKHANEYDLWAKRLREQAKVENEAEDLAYLERENIVRQKLRAELKERLGHLEVGAHRLAVESALHCLDRMEDRRKRYRDTFQFAEAFEATKPTEDVTEKLIRNN